MGNERRGEPTRPEPKDASEGLKARDLRCSSFLIIPAGACFSRPAPTLAVIAIATRGSEGDFPSAFRPSQALSLRVPPAFRSPRSSQPAAPVSETTAPRAERRGGDGNRRGDGKTRKKGSA